MDGNRFDSFARSLERRSNRRSALKGLTSAGAAGLVAGFTRVPDPAAAQDATPIASPDASSSESAFLFVQLADSGTWGPVPGSDAIYRLTLGGASTQVIYFSDRPDRIVGTVPTELFLEQLGFTPLNPPNAAVVVHTLDGAQDVLVVELFDPVYTQAFGEQTGDVLTYSARVLEAYEGTALEPWALEADDDQLPLEFTDVSLFIDDCPPVEWCYKPLGGTAHERMGPVPSGPYARCYNTFKGCIPCKDSTFNDYYARHYDKLCNAYAGCDRQCFAL